MSMPVIVWRAGLFDGTNREDSEETILKLLAVLVDRNCKYLRAHPETPKVYDADVTYALPDQMTRAPDPKKLARLEKFLREEMSFDEEAIEIVFTILKGCEIFRDVPMILEKKRIDCDNLACWRAAELRVGGIEAVPYIIWREEPRGTTYHVLVRWPDGTSEDPSIIKGMGGETKRAERDEEKRKNRERYESQIAAARHFIDAGWTTTKEAGHRIDALGLIPRDGSW